MLQSPLILRHRPAGRTARLVVLLSLLVSACGTTPTVEEESAPAAIFYPPLPNPPRIQYLTSFSSSADVTPEPTTFSQFVLGSDQARDIVPIVKPYGVTFHDGRLYAVDTRGPGYVILDLSGHGFKTVTGAGGGRMEKPINITIDADGTRYVTDTGRGQVLVFDTADRFVRAYGLKGQFKPSDVAIIADRLYVADLKHNNIQVLDKGTGELLFTFGKAGSREGELFFPTNLAVGPGGDLYVSDTGNYRIQRFSPEGRFIESQGSVGLSLGQFARPKGIALDRAGRLYVVDAAFENVQIFGPDHKLLLFFGEPGSRPENINLPADITISYEAVPYFRTYADPGFRLRYVILVSSQFGRSKINAYGFGTMEGMQYPAGP